MTNPPLPVERRLEIALELQDMGIELMRQNFARRHPAATRREIGEFLIDWMRSRPPDSPGRPTHRFVD